MPASSCPWLAHPVSCLFFATLRPVQTRFRFGSGFRSLNLATSNNSQAHSPRGTPSGFPCGIALRLLVSLRFQVLFHSPYRGTFHLSLTVLVLYRSLCVFSLGKWTPQLHTVLACTVLLRYRTRALWISRTGLSPSLADFPTSFRYLPAFFTCRPALQPRKGSTHCGLGFSHFARHYFGNILFSSGYLDVSVPRVPFFTLLVHVKMTEVRSAGFPHSDIPGSALVHSSPGLFAVSHVLLRHSAPRHPP